MSRRAKKQPKTLEQSLPRTRAERERRIKEDRKLFVTLLAKQSQETQDRYAKRESVHARADREADETPLGDLRTKAITRVENKVGAWQNFEKLYAALWETIEGHDLDVIVAATLGMASVTQGEAKYEELMGSSKRSGRMLTFPTPTNAIQ